MKRTDLSPTLIRLLATVPYVTIASACPDGNPWNTPVYGCFDDELNLYWASWTNNQHSRNIAERPEIFVVIYDPHAPEGEAIGLYLQMTAKKLTRKADIEQARRVYISNFGENGVHEPFCGECPRRLYKATVRSIWHNSDAYIRGNFVDVRCEIMPRAGQ